MNAYACARDAALWLLEVLCSGLHAIEPAAAVRLWEIGAAVALRADRWIA